MTITEAPIPTPALDDPAQVDRTLRAIRSRSFAVLATVSDGGFPHAACVAFCAVGQALYVNTERSSRKARRRYTGGRFLRSRAIRSVRWNGFPVSLA